MKKNIILSLALVLCCTALPAQGLSEALLFGGNDYTGSARSLGMGNAVTAVGCDLGSVGINPAGAAVAGYSQFTISPSLSISSSLTSFALTPESDFQNPYRTSGSRFLLPNAGIAIRYENYGSSLKSITYSIISNTTNNYFSTYYGEGINRHSSKFAEMANAVNGISSDILSSPSFYDSSEYSNLWDAAMGYKVGLINSYGSGKKYVGCTEVLTDTGDHYVPGDLSQRSSRTVAGNKNDLVMNMAMNFNDKFYLGFNFAMPFMSYSTVESFSEVAQVPEEFPVQFTYTNGYVENTYFSNATYQYNYNASMAGIYGKLGFIWLPSCNLRLGFAYQTPSLYEIEENWCHSGLVRYDNGTTYSGNGERGTYTYSMVSPQEFDFGIAYTFGQFGMLSVDYSLTDYGVVSYSDIYSDGYYDFTNTALNAFLGLQHNLRAGVELNVTPSFMLRGGFTLLTSPEKYYVNPDGSTVTYYDYDDDYYLGRKQLPIDSRYNYLFKDMTRSWSVGFGYNPASSFFADFALSCKYLPSSIYQPYYDYADLKAPQFSSSSKLVQAVLTLGWRF
ncbi:MAG: hypothetical protein ACI3ZK_00685 [Candidatus Cryptobacteroides sp.]